ncbi:MAG: AAA family ATPase [Legionellales bacterium]|nr:AAA family ATPase [Legionellales bacterium]
MSLIIKRLLNESDQSFFLFGPRGTGKSTLLKAQYQDALWIDLLMPDVFRQYFSYPERLLAVIEATPNLSTVVIDEIQKVPALLTVVHSLIEEKRGIKFILTGSSARKLKQTGADLLGGRAAWRTLHPFMASELGTHFSLSAALKNGLLPLGRVDNSLC